METYDQKRRRIYGKLFLPQYINTLNKILNKSIGEKDLLSIIDTDLIIELGRGDLYLEKIIPFNDKESFQQIVINNILGLNERIHVFIEHAKECGTVAIDSMSEFNFQFNYDDEPVGLISLMIEKTAEELLLDFYEENGMQFLKIEIYNKYMNNLVSN